MQEGPPIQYVEIGRLYKKGGNLEGNIGEPIIVGFNPPTIYFSQKPGTERQLMEYDPLTHTEKRIDVQP